LIKKKTNMVNITRSGDSVLVTSFDNSQFPWSDGELSVPLDSIYYILEDETDFIVFKSVYDDSIMFTALIDEIHVNDVKVTRDTIIELIDNVINSNGGSASAGVNSINGFQGDVNIKSINGESLIGSGDITIEGGGDIDTSKFITNVTVMGGDRIVAIQENGNVPSEIYFPTINGQQILGVEGNITIEGGSGGVTAINIGQTIEDWTQKTGIVSFYTNFYDGSYDVNISGTSFYGLKPIDGSIVLENAGGTVNGNFRCGIKVNEWTGTQSEYDALGTYDSNCTYNIIEG